MTGMPRQEMILRAKEIVHREADAVRAFAAQLDDGLVDVLSLMLNCEGHVLVTGAGTSRAIAQRLAHLLSCSGTPSLFISASDGLHGGSGAVTEKDVVYLISKGGHSAEINQFAEIARSRGAKLIAQTENPGSPLAQMCDAVFKVVAEGDVDRSASVDYRAHGGRVCADFVVEAGKSPVGGEVFFD